MRIVLITDKPIHYRVDLFNTMLRLYRDDVFFFFAPDPRFSARNAISVFTNEPFLLRSSFFYYQSGVKRGVKLLLSLLEKKPDVIINVGMSLRLPLLLIYAKTLGKRLFVWWGGTLESEKKVPFLKHLYRRCMLFFTDGVLCYSKLAEEYIRDITKSIQKCWIIGNNTFDSRRYHAEIVRLRAALPRQGNDLRIISVGFLAERKNILTLLRVYGVLKNSHEQISLLIVGDGPELTRLRSFAEQYNLSDVTFAGFIGHKEMPTHYAAADIYVHPAFMDQWPQTFNEAAAAELPILISSKSGVTNAYTEMYADKVIFDPYDEARLSSLLDALITNLDLRKKLGAAAQQAAFDFDCNSVVKKVDRVLNGETF